MVAMSPLQHVIKQTYQIDVSTMAESPSSSSDDELATETLKLRRLAALWTFLSIMVATDLVFGLLSLEKSRRRLISKEVNLDETRWWDLFLINFSWHLCWDSNLFMFHVRSFSLFQEASLLVRDLSFMQLQVMYFCCCWIMLFPTWCYWCVTLWCWYLSQYLVLEGQQYHQIWGAHLTSTT